MPSRQDQLHSYQYSMQRVVAALVTHDPDPSRSPLRRAGTTALVSLLIAAIAVGGTALYGQLTGHSGVSPTDPQVIFQEKGTGARFVYQPDDRALHPVLNYSSALLLTEGRPSVLKSVSANKLATVPLGPPLGIPGAPDALPGAADLLTGSWSVCTDDNDASGTPQSTLLVGDALTDGTVAVQAHVALLVSDPAQNVFLIDDNRRFQVPPGRETQTLGVLGWNDQRPWPVSTAWINAVPAGPDLRGPVVPRAGESSRDSGLPVGQLVTDGSQFAVIMPDGSQAGVTALQAALMQAEDGVGKPIDIGTDLFKLRKSPPLSNVNDPASLPSKVPDLVSVPPSRVCVTLPVDAKTGAGVRINPNYPAGASVSGGSTGRADLVHVARAKGALVVGSAAVSSALPGAAQANPPAGGTLGLVTDTGRLFTLASPDLLAKLGYDGKQPQPIPAQLLAMLPRGPSLDPVQARRADP